MSRSDKVKWGPFSSFPAKVLINSEKFINIFFCVVYCLFNRKMNSFVYGFINMCIEKFWHRPHVLTHNVLSSFTGICVLIVLVATSFKFDSLNRMPSIWKCCCCCCGGGNETCVYCRRGRERYVYRGKRDRCELWGGVWPNVYAQ